MARKNPVVQELIEKTLKELSAPKQPTQRSRVWTHPEGYRYLVQWSNSVLLRHLINLLTNSLPKSGYRKKAQLDDAARSVVRNIEEGYKRANTAPYIEFLSFSQGSLEEVKGDIRDLTQDGFLKTKPGSSLKDLGIDLGAFNKVLHPSGNPLNSSKYPLKDHKRSLSSIKGELKDIKGFQTLEILYPPLARVKAENLTYEIFLELINKTDYLLRKLVESLERKLASERKHYQVEQSRIRSRFGRS